jgi:hypothetical protein
MYITLLGKVEISISKYSQYLLKTTLAIAHINAEKQSMSIRRRQKRGQNVNQTLQGWYFVAFC